MEDSWFPSSDLLPASSSSVLSSLSAPLQPQSRLSSRPRVGKLAAGDCVSPLTPHLYPRTPFCSPNSSPHPLTPRSPASEPQPQPGPASAHHLHAAQPLLSAPPRKKAVTALPADGLTISISGSSGGQSVRSQSMPFLDLSELLLLALHRRQSSTETPHSSPQPHTLGTRELDAPPSPLLLLTTAPLPDSASAADTAAASSVPSCAACTAPSSSSSPFSSFTSPSRPSSTVSLLHIPAALAPPLASPTLPPQTPHPSPSLAASDSAGNAALHLMPSPLPPSWLAAGSGRPLQSSSLFSPCLPPPLCWPHASSASSCTESEPQQQQQQRQAESGSGGEQSSS